MQQFQDALADQTPLSVDESLDSSHDRQVKRLVQVFAAPPAVTALWKQAQSLVVVNRSGLREAHPFETTSFCLSSLTPNALELGLDVRRHRDIENGLHWVRDVVFKEDAAPFVDLRTALNWSLMRTIALNLFRAKGYPSLTRAIRLLGHDLCGLLSLLTKN